MLGGPGSLQLLALITGSCGAHCFEVKSVVIDTINTNTYLCGYASIALYPVSIYGVDFMGIKLL